MSDPVLDRIERGLREMSEPSRTDAGEPTELWKRALEISRAEERAGLVHAGADRAERPRGRRMLYALNAVGVAAMVLLAAGVWTVIRVAPETEKAGIVSDKLASVKAESPERALSIFPDKMEPEGAAELAMADESGAADVLGDLGMSGDREPFESIAAPASDALAGLQAKSTDLADHSLARSRSITKDDIENESFREAPTELARRAEMPPGLMQMDQAVASGLTLEGGDASVMALGTLLVNTEIVIEVADRDEAFNTVSGLPDADFDEFGFVDPFVETEVGAEQLVLNIAPERVDEALKKIRTLGRVVEERHELDSFSNRANTAVNWAADAIAPSAQALQQLVDEQGMTEHERRHHGLDESRSDAERLEEVRSAIATIARRLEESRLSMNLSRIRVSIRQARESDTIPE